MEKQQLPYCPDCGPATVSHSIERFSVRMDTIFSYATQPFVFFLSGVKPFILKLKPGRLAPALAQASAAIGVAQIVAHPDNKVNDRTRVLWQEAERRGIAMREWRLLGLAREFFFASYQGDTVAFDGIPRPRSAHGRSLSWMDNKGVILKKFRHHGIPVPRGKSCTTIQQAQEIFMALGAPVIVKPSLGSRSRHTYVHLVDLPSLSHAFLKAQELSPYVVVQEELPGFVFRITLIDFKIAGVMRREAPHVIGNGNATVGELIEKENKNPLRRGPIFHELLSAEDALQELKKHGMTFDAVPEKNVMIFLHEKVSRAYGASTTEVTDIHPDNEALFLKIARVLDDPVVGVDFIIEDMSRSWREQKCGVIECNSLPFIDLHHYPYRGPARNVAGAVWDMIFPDSRPA